MMAKTNTQRSDILSSIYRVLPEIDDDYAARLVYRAENKSALKVLQSNMLNLLLSLEQPHIIADTMVAKILLDEISLPAATQFLRVKGNAFSLLEVADVLELPEKDTTTLINFYASVGSEHFFDTDFPAEFKKLPKDQDLSDIEKVRQVISKLLEKAKQIIAQQGELPLQNQEHIYRFADKYYLSLSLTSQLIHAYTTPGTMEFKKQFEQIFDSLQAINKSEMLNASLTAKTLLMQLTPQEAKDITLASKLLKGRILEDDLVVIARRYLTQKTPQDIADTFNAVLERLPHIKQKEENLQLAVRVLLDGTESTFEQAQQVAALQREQNILSNALQKHDVFSGYEQELVKKFAGQKNATELLKQAEEILKNLPHTKDPNENRDLACKVLLGTLTAQQARQQASSRQANTH